MKKALSFVMLLALGCFTIGCQTEAEKLQSEQKDVIEAEQDLAEEKQDEAQNMNEAVQDAREDVKDQAQSSVEEIGEARKDVVEEKAEADAQAQKAAIEAQNPAPPATP